MASVARARLLVLVLSLAAVSTCYGQEVSLGDLDTAAHDTRAEVVVISDRLVEFRNFEYDGLGPAAFFWADSNPVPSSDGIRLLDATPSSSCGTARLPGADGTLTFKAEFPEGTSVRDFVGGSISVWCEAANQNFGEVVVPEGLLDDIPETDAGTLACEEDEEPPEFLQTPEGYNCEPLLDDYHVRWKLEGDTSIAFEVVARILPTEYMGFGPSGSQTGTQMVGSDPVIADRHQGNFRAIDFYMTARSQCSEGTGVCPDQNQDSPGSDDVTEISGEVDVSRGITLVRYTRPIAPSDVDATVTSGDTPVDGQFRVGPGEFTFVSWAIGPLSETTGFPLIHPQTSRPAGDVSFEFGRETQDNCDPFPEATQEEAAARPYERPRLSDVTEFTAHIGPSGSQSRGVEAITGRPGWGIAWYINDELIPEIIARRGVTYTFKVNGGNDPDDSAKFHPFYITEDPVGGFAQKSAEDRLLEGIQAGVSITVRNDSGVAEFESTALAPICQYLSGEAVADDDSYDDFIASLDTSCRDDSSIMDAAATLEWTPDEDTPDTVYYQCVTHQNLGWRILVEDEVDEEDEEGESGVCFPGTAIVELEGGNRKEMANLQIGDRIRTGPRPEDFEEVYFFSHRDPKAKTSFVKVSVENKQVVLSPGHLLVTDGGKLIPAGKVTTGTNLWDSKGIPRKVSGVARATGQGLYAPHTLGDSGTLVVNGILASEFTQALNPTVARWLLSPVKTLYKLNLLRGGSLSFLDTRGHWIARYVPSPFSRLN